MAGVWKMYNWVLFLQILNEILIEILNEILNEIFNEILNEIFNEKKTLTFETNCVYAKCTRVGAVVVLRAGDVHQLWFYCNQMSIAQSSSFKRNINI